MPPLLSAPFYACEYIHKVRFPVKLNALQCLSSTYMSSSPNQCGFLAVCNVCCIMSIVVVGYVAGYVAQGIEVIETPPHLLGMYKSKLNHYRQVGRIHSFTWLDEEVQQGDMSGFISHVDVNFKDGHKIRCSSEDVYSKKSVSREAAATKAIDMIETLALPPTDQLIYSSPASLAYKGELDNF